MRIMVAGSHEDSGQSSTLLQDRGENDDQRGILLKPMDNTGLEVTKLEEQICQLEVKRSEVAMVLERLKTTFSARAAPFEDELKNLVLEKESLSAELLRKTAPSAYPPAPGPHEMRFVDSEWFSATCNAVVVLNLTCMALANQLEAYHSILYIFDQLFLIWYVLELGAKWQYHRSNLFFGSISVVWWNWLDAGIVIGGVADQWFMALVKTIIPVQLPTGLSNWLRCLRLFRVLRCLKVLKYFLLGDMSWTEKAPFQLLMSAVIAVNSVVMALELDISWDGWDWFEQGFLLIYTFEPAVRMKAVGCSFFVNDDLVWNNLDFAMVGGGVFSLWLMPAWSMLQSMISGKPSTHTNAASNLLKILRIAKILRVLRLVRLLRMVKPLYALLVGVLAALDAMKWVMILTMLVLYAGAIVFTSLIGHGYIYSSMADIPPEAEEYFGSVAQSIFSLFKVMNGDISVVEPITTDIKGRLLFACFMILSNWAVLAILTSVVSDHMISTSAKLAEEDKLKDEEDQFLSRDLRLKKFFEEADNNGDGKVSKAEWTEMLSDGERLQHLTDLTGYDCKNLHEMFFILSQENKSKEDFYQTGDGKVESYLRFSDFVDHLNHDKEQANRSQILHLRYWLEKVTLRKLKDVESNIEDRFADLEETVEKAMGLPAHAHRRPSGRRNSTSSMTPARFRPEDSCDDVGVASTMNTSQQDFPRSLPIPSSAGFRDDVRNMPTSGLGPPGMEDIAFLSKNRDWKIPRDYESPAMSCGFPSSSISNGHVFDRTGPDRYDI